MKAIHWLSSNVLDVANKSKGEAPASMSAVPHEGKLGLDVVLMGGNEMTTCQTRTWKRTTDKASRANFYYNRKTRRSTWTSPTAAKTNEWTEHVHVDGGVVYEDQEGNTVEEKPEDFDSRAYRPKDSLHTTMSFHGISVTSFENLGDDVDPTKNISDVELARIAIQKIRNRRRPPWAKRVPIKVIYLSVSNSDLNSLRFSLKDINKDPDCAQVYISGCVVPYGRDSSKYCRAFTRALMSKPAPVAPRLIKWDLIDKDDNVRGTSTENVAASIYSTSRRSGRYVQMPKPLGAGAFGTVYAAISDNGDTVAVKHIDKVLMRKKKKESDVNHELGIQVWLSQTNKERAQYEGTLELSPSLSLSLCLSFHTHTHTHTGAHTNISSLIEIFEEPHSMNIVVEIAENGSFFDLCKNRFANGSPFNEEESRHYFRQILSGVNFCHKKGISHRDLKPENLLLGGPLGNTIKICDFGLANWVRVLCLSIYLSSHIRSPQPNSGKRK